MASSSSAAAAAASSATGNRNRAADANPPAIPPPPIHPPPPQPQRPAVYVQEMYLDPLRRRRLFFRRRETAFICRALIWVLSIFLAFACLSVLMWLILHPTFPQLHVISANLSSVSASGTAASADCNITFLLANPNRHLKTIYDAMEFSLVYPPRTTLLSQDQHPPFAQPKQSRSTLNADLSFNSIDLGSDVVTAMKQDLDRGSLSLTVKILAVVSYRNGKWKTTPQFMRAYCGGVSFGFTSTEKPGIFLNPYQECEVYLYTK